ncbi:MAG: FAD-dependent oxidoreductase [Candidatus Woesearchaeota archaeon]
MAQTFDLIIIGGGCTGFGAAMYAGRMNLKTLVIVELRGGLITWTDSVENYPGFKKLTGSELAKKIEEHAMEYDIEIFDGRATKVVKEGNLFKVKAENREFTSKTVLFATGTKIRELEIPGEKEFRGKGVHHCALCDGAFYKNKVVAVIGGSDSAAKEALLLTQYARKVYMIYRGEKIRPEPINYDRIMQNKKIEIIYKTNLKEIKGTKFVESIVLDNPYKGSNELKLDGIFLAIGHVSLSQLAQEIGVKVNQKGEIIINKNAETNVPGVYAAGDVVDTRFKQAIIGVAEGILAVYSAYEYISKQELCKE